MKKRMYLKLQLKRAFKLYPMILIITVFTLVCIAVTAFALLNANTQSESKQKIRIGLVGDIKESYLGIGVYALQNMDNSRFFVDFTEFENKEEADNALNKKDIKGYVYVPDGYIKNILRGHNESAKYIAPKEPQGLGSILVDEVAKTASSLVTQSQSGIYGAMNFVKDHAENEVSQKAFDKLNLSYASFVLNRNDTYKLELSGIKDELTYGGYYICGILTFFLMIWGISCNKLLWSKNYGLSGALNCRGIKIAWQILFEYLGFLAVTMVTLLLFSVFFGYIVSGNDFGIRELQGADIFVCTGFIIKIIPAVIMFTAMHMMMYEIFTGSPGAVLAQFIIAIGLGYVSGCFYPNTFFPARMQTVAEFLPSGAGFGFIRKMMSGNSIEKELLIVALYSVLFAVIAVSVREYKVKREGTK